MMIDLDTYNRLEALLYAIKARVEAADTFDEVVAGLVSDGYDMARVREMIRPPVDADLHSHSNHSDGNLPPRKIAWLAKLFGLEGVSVSDHDSVSGVPEAVAAGDALGVTVLPGLEFGTGRAGLEILTYFPDAHEFVRFLDTDGAQPFLDYLAAIQQQIHDDTTRVIDHVNAFLAGHGVGQEDSITAEELGEWFSGQEPYYPGTTAVLGLKRLPPALRDELGIHDPREFNTRVVSPAMKQIRASRGPADDEGDGLARVFEQVESLRGLGVRCVTLLAHPRELETKGKMGRDETGPFIADLCERYGLDGLEVSNARDTAEDVAHWHAAADRIDASGPARHKLIRSCFSSDFHILAPGTATGEITLGFGVLDERPEHRGGNLHSCAVFSEVIEQVSRYAR